MFHTIEGHSVANYPTYQQCRLSEVRDFNELGEEHVREQITEKLIKSDYYSGKDLANIAVRFREVHCEDYLFLNILIREIELNIHNDNFFDGQDISNMVCSFANLKCNDWRFLHSLKGAVLRNLQVPNFFTENNLADIALAFLSLNDKYYKFFKTLKSCIEKLTELASNNNLGHDEFVNSTKVLREFGCEDGNIDAITNLMMFNLEDRDNPGSLNGYGLVDFMRVYEEYTCESYRATGALINCIVFENNHLFSPYDLFKIICYFAKFEFGNKNDIVASLANAIKHHLEDLTFLGTGEVAEIAWAFAKLGYEDQDLISILANRIIPNLRRWKGDIDLFSNEDLIKITWAFAKFGYQDSVFVHALLDHIGEISDLFILPEVNNRLSNLESPENMTTIRIYGLDKVNLQLSKFPHRAYEAIGEYLNDQSKDEILTNAYLFAGKLSDLGSDIYGVLDRRMIFAMHINAKSLRIAILDNS